MLEKTSPFMQVRRDLDMQCLSPMAFPVAKSRGGCNPTTLPLGFGPSRERKESVG